MGVPKASHWILCQRRCWWHQRPGLTQQRAGLWWLSPFAWAMSGSAAHKVHNHKRPVSLERTKSKGWQARHQYRKGKIWFLGNYDRQARLRSSGNKWARVYGNDLGLAVAACGHWCPHITPTRRVARTAAQEHSRDRYARSMPSLVIRWSIIESARCMHTHRCQGSETIICTACTWKPERDVSIRNSGLSQDTWLPASNTIPDGPVWHRPGGTKHLCTTLPSFSWRGDRGATYR